MGEFADCPQRGACTRDSLQLRASRDGSRQDFEALYERYFARCFSVARERLASPLAEVCTREVLATVLCIARDDGGCVASDVWKILQHSLRRMSAASEALTAPRDRPLWEC